MNRGRAAWSERREGEPCPSGGRLEAAREGGFAGCGLPRVPTVPTGSDRVEQGGDTRAYVMGDDGHFVPWVEREDVRLVVEDLFRHERWHPHKIAREMGLTRDEARTILRGRRP